MNSQTEDLVQKKQVRERYNYEVKRYEASRFGSPRGRFFDFIEKNYASQFLIPGSVLHVGTAKGRFVSYLSNLGFHYTGVEISDLMAEATKTRISRESVVADIIQADGENPPIRLSSFDNVLSVRSFHSPPAGEISEKHL
jgi:2-polyprenyl-3-methyl-5-hydroxy-6-metoxy-1,4-benzoquinol methylase